jgi:SPW repeat
MNASTPNRNPLGWQYAWQDVATLILGIWLFISPWVLQFGGSLAGPGAEAATASVTSSSAAWDAWILGIIGFAVSASALAAVSLWQEWVNLILGIWLFIAPWVLAFIAMQRASWDHWIVGVLVFVIAGSRLLMTGTGRTSTADLAHAGSKPGNTMTRP